MRRTTNERDRARLALAELARSYDAERSRVEAAHERVLAVMAIPHPPALAREAAHELTVALRDATETATRALQPAALAVRPVRRLHLTRRKPDRCVPAGVRFWSAELVRLAAIGAWLRRAVLDDPGVPLPRTVRVANYAAKGPHIAGLHFGNQAAESPDSPRIGIDLAASIDATCPVPGVSAGPVATEPVAADAGAAGLPAAA